MSSRRTFLKQGVLAVGAMGAGLPVFASTTEHRLHRQPIGLQLYTLGDAVVTDTARSMDQLASFGYEELEAIAYPSLKPETLRRYADEAGLKLRSVHLEFSTTADVASLFDTAHRLGVTQVVSSVLSPSADIKNPDFGHLTADDFKRIAARANHIGDLARQEGLRYAYHNHDFEFRKLGAGTIGYNILLYETDAQLVFFQADCGWMSTVGANPAAYFRRYPGRYLSAHIKDFDAVHRDAKSPGRIVQLGRGVIDYRPILKAARETGVKHLFVEHDPPGGVPIPMEEVQREGQYLRKLTTA